MNVEFLDSNVLLYAYTNDEPVKHLQSIQLINRLWEERLGALSTQSLVEFYAVSTRKLGLSHKLALEAVENLRPWKIHRPRADDVIQAARLHQKHKISFWDAMIVNSAIESGAVILWTEDLNDGQRFGDLIVRNPFKQ